MNNREKTTKKIVKLLKKIKKTYDSYVVTLPEDIQTQEDAHYLSLACFEDSIMFDSDTEMREFAIKHWENGLNVQKDNKA